MNLKYTTVSFKNKKRIRRPESEQLRFENTHEALIDQQTWDIVQDIRKHKRRRTNMEEQNIFSGLVYCADCGGTMVLHRAHTMDAVKNNFMCSTYKKKGKDICTAHYFREVDLAAILLDDIRRVTHFARQNEMLFKRLYEDNVLSRILDEQYRLLSQGYTEEQNKIKKRQPIAEARLEELRSSAANIARFLENARKYTEIKELASEILRIFIQRVEIGERSQKYSRSATQEIKIYYRDIGILDDTPEVDMGEQTMPKHDTEEVA